MKPMEMTRIGTVQDPIPIYSLVSPNPYKSSPRKEDKRKMGVREDQRKCLPERPGTLSRRPLFSSCLHPRRPSSSVLASLKPRTTDIADLQFPERHVGCTGFPADSHDTIWMLVNDKIKNHRCPECGCGMSLLQSPTSLCTLTMRGDLPRAVPTLINSLQTQLPR